MMAKDNGGAVAQKGFNYQNHVISLVAIRNYSKKNFSIYVEADEDFEVTYDENYHAYIQVKGQKKLSLTKLLYRNTKKPSIFEKHLSSGDNDSSYKIVVFEFSEEELNEMLKDDKNELFGNALKLNDKQKKKVVMSLGEDSKLKLENFSLIKTSFKNDSIEARKYLKGELVDQKISVDGRDNIILDELSTLIKQKSEHILVTENDKQLKKITSDELRLIICKLSAKERFEKELDYFNFSSIKKQKIKNEELKIVVDYMTIKRKAIELLLKNNNRLENEPLTRYSSELITNEIFNNINENAKYAIIISAYCDILEGIANE